MWLGWKTDLCKKNNFGNRMETDFVGLPFPKFFSSHDLAKIVRRATPRNFSSLD